MNSPPLLVSFGDPSNPGDVERLVSALAEDLRTQHADEIWGLVRRGLPPAVSVRVLAILFGLSSRMITSMCRNPERHYRVFEIKTGRKVRQIQSPRVALKLIQKWLGHHIARAVQFGPEVCGFVPNVSTVDGAALHCCSRWVCSTDIRDFFRSTTTFQVREALTSHGYSPTAAEMIARLSSYLGTLAQGAPSSPVLANLAFSKVDEELRKLASRTDSRYSRYADDVIFSGTREVPLGLEDEITGIITRHGWKVALEKRQMAIHPARLKVYGLLVHGEAPRLTKGYRRKLRAYAHLQEQGKIASADLARVSGHLAYASGVAARVRRRS